MKITKEIHTEQDNLIRIFLISEVGTVHVMLNGEGYFSADLHPPDDSEQGYSNECIIAKSFMVDTLVKEKFKTEKL